MSDKAQAIIQDLVDLCEGVPTPTVFDCGSLEAVRRVGAAKKYLEDPSPLEVHSEKGLREALEDLLHACVLADGHDELSVYIDGSLLDAARKALAATPAVREPGPTRFQDGLEAAARQVENYYMSGKGEQLRTLATMIRNLSSSSAGEASPIPDH